MNNDSNFLLYDHVAGVGQIAYPDDLDKDRIEQCKYCGRGVYASNMDNHIKGNHGKFYNFREIVKCDFCGKRMKKIGMASHLKDKHGIK